MSSLTGITMMALDTGDAEDYLKNFQANPTVKVLAAIPYVFGKQPGYIVVIKDLTSDS